MERVTARKSKRLLSKKLVIVKRRWTWKKAVLRKLPKGKKSTDATEVPVVAKVPEIQSKPKSLRKIDTVHV